MGMNVMMRRAAGRLVWESGRWLSAGKLLLVSVLTALCAAADFCSGYAVVMKGIRNLSGSVLRNFMSTSGIIENVGLCLAMFLGSGLYARDYESGAVCPRVQRMGMARYAGLRVWQTVSSSFISGCLGLLLMFLMLSAALGMPAFFDPSETGLFEGVSDSLLLRQGRVASYVVLLLILAGLRTVFYSLLTLGISLAVPNWRVLAAVPMLLWYLFQYILPWFEQLPPWLHPGLVFDLHSGLSPRILAGGRLGEWGLLCCVAATLALLAAAVWLLFWLRLRRNGIFGGDQE